MASAKKISSKRSATSSVWPPPDAPTLFIDRSAWSHRLAEALRNQGIRFIALHDRFAIDVPDIEWLRSAGDEGWIVLSRDKRIRRKPNELAAVQASKVVMFTLVAGNATAADTAEIIDKALARIFALDQGREAASAICDPPRRFNPPDQVALIGARRCKTTLTFLDRLRARSTSRPPQQRKLRTSAPP